MLVGWRSSNSRQVRAGVPGHPPNSLIKNSSSYTVSSRFLEKSPSIFLNVACWDSTGAQVSRTNGPIIGNVGGFNMKSHTINLARKY